MKKLIPFFAYILLFSAAGAQTNNNVKLKKDPAKKVLNAEAACGQCQLGLTGGGCNLAVRINGVSYFVDGTDIDSHGDAHASDGFCNAISKAEVQGTVVNGRFRVTWFKIMEEKPAAKEKGRR